MEGGQKDALLRRAKVLKKRKKDFVAKYKYLFDMVFEANSIFTFSCSFEKRPNKCNGLDVIMNRTNSVP